MTVLELTRRATFIRVAAFTAVAVTVIVAALPGITSAQTSTDTSPLFTRQHQAGVRLGVWSNSGATPPANTADSVSGIIQTSDINSASFFLEGYFGYRLTRLLMAELSFGLSNRGDVVTRDTQFGINDVAALNIYPILVQLKLYAPGLMNHRLYPYAAAGGGIYYARNSIQVTDEYYYAQFREASETDFNYVLGGGFDYVLASQVGLDFNVKYMPVTFSDRLVGVTDYSALTITVGIKYLYLPAGR
jgi:outer membrane protein W